ncbi:hypothetical protein EYF80_001948 [Liparis tanakae]|uniref:GIY-YIG domain-containing protein n=1 Tax=Liparis tanakae TaxID=230148 RepID=A0A4Z2JDR2_9TELE|nr:hypothetical protein EYF80_001948 [Liparis tanakae]
MRYKDSITTTLTPTPTLTPYNNIIVPKSQNIYSSPPSDTTLSPQQGEPGLVATGPNNEGAGVAAPTPVPPPEAARPPAPPGSLGRREPYRHLKTHFKQKYWSLEVGKRTLFLGDSNLSSIPPFTHPDIQVDSFPGAGFGHLTELLIRQDPHPHTLQLILSLGIINCLSQTQNTTIRKQLQALHSTAHRIFPNATIYIPLLNFSPRLPPIIQQRLIFLNKLITLKYNCLSDINPLLFKVNKDNIHWTPRTAGVIFRGYSRRFLRTIKAEVAGAFRDGNYTAQPPAHSLVPLVLNFSEAIHDFIKKIKHNFSGAREHCAALGASRVISAFRRNKNLKDILVHTDLNKKETRKEALRVSGIGFIRLPHIFNPQSKIGFNVDQVLLPTASNVIYAVRCRTCRKLYVGETGNQLQLRVRQHLYMITSGKGTSVLYVHFKLHGPHSLQSLEGNRQWTRTQRQAAERRACWCLFTSPGTGRARGVAGSNAVSHAPPASTNLLGKLQQFPAEEDEQRPPSSSAVSTLPSAVVRPVQSSEV